MDLIACQPVKGVRAGEKFTCTKDEGEWFIANGYARTEKGDDGGYAVESTPVKKDQTLAQNRETPAETPPGVLTEEQKLEAQQETTAAGGETVEPVAQVQTSEQNRNTKAARASTAKR